MTGAITIRMPAVAGYFYPSQKSSLTVEVDGLLARATPPNLTGSAVAVIAPHAGYQYSGLTAAHAYLPLRRAEFETIVVVSPSHHEYFDGISVYDGAGYATPLGTVDVNEPMRALLTDNDAFIFRSSAGHREEHALEVQLPFLQRIASGFTLLPIVMGDQRREYALHLGKRLAEALRGSRALLVASSDLSHYHPYDVAKRLDGIVIEDVREFDEMKLMHDLESRNVEACGGGPMVAVMLAARLLGADVAQILHHCNSGDVTGERDRVVGYLSAMLLRTH